MQSAARKKKKAEERRFDREAARKQRRACFHRPTREKLTQDIDALISASFPQIAKRIEAAVRSGARREDLVGFVYDQPEAPYPFTARVVPYGELEAAVRLAGYSPDGRIAQVLRDVGTHIGTSTQIPIIGLTNEFCLIRIFREIEREERVQGVQDLIEKSTAQLARQREAATMNGTQPEDLVGVVYNRADAPQSIAVHVVAFSDLATTLREADIYPESTYDDLANKVQSMLGSPTQLPVVWVSDGCWAVARISMATEDELRQEVQRLFNVALPQIVEQRDAALRSGLGHEELVGFLHDLAEAPHPFTVRVVPVTELEGTMQRVSGYADDDIAEAIATIRPLIGNIPLMPVICLFGGFCAYKFLQDSAYYDS